ncbi:ABC transporter permease [Brumimicrobium aurantiacum]|nr:FtsX-like permease family protein [Brumimicrobium aurantiacum]
MNKIYYIAKKIHKGKGEDKKVSQPITRIARLSIILAMVINIITLAVVTGFQNKVKDKVIGFGSHATIVKAGENSTFESAPVIYDDSLEAAVKKINGVQNIQPFAYKPALLQSDPDTNFYRVNDIDTFQVQQEIHGIVMKGVNAEYDWSFFKKHIVEGGIPNVQDSIPHNEIIISTQVAKNLNTEIGEFVNVFFVKATPVKLKYKVTGIFKTGLQEFDEQVVIGDIRNVQKLNDWGIQTSIRVADTVNKDGQFIIYADTRGGNGNYRHDWGKGYENAQGFTYCDTKDTTIRLISSDYFTFIDGFGEMNTIPDTAYLKVTVEGNKRYPCYPKETELGQFKKEFLNESGTKFAVNLKGGKRVTFEYIDGKGSHQNYVGGYEVEVNDFAQLSQIAEQIRRTIYFPESGNHTDYRVRTIANDQQEIFIWLDFLNINVVIILVLMLLIGTINMGSGLLVLIITKTHLIGLLKALGTSNWEIRKLFLYQAVFIIFRAVVIGNVVGIGLCLLQEHFTIIPLNPEVYYLDAAPIELNYLHILFLNIGTIVLCTAALIIPSYVVTKISPIKALKFD